MVIHGTAADIMKGAMVRCAGALKDGGLETRLILQIHDELLFEGPEGEAERVKVIACREMGDAFEMDPPLAVEAGIGPDWLQAK
jgi:DNA polymerase-1